MSDNVPLSQQQLSLDESEKEQIWATLRTYQIPHVKALINSLQIRNRALDASDTGTGKTYCAVAICKLLGLKPIIICPKSVLTTWLDVLTYFDADYYGFSNYDLIQNCRWFRGGSYTPSPDQSPSTEGDMKWFAATEPFKKTACPYLLRKEKTPRSNQALADRDAPARGRGRGKTRGRGRGRPLADTELPPLQDARQADGTFKLAKSTTNFATKDLKYYFIFKDLPDDCILIFDEAHKCKNKRTVNNALFKASAELDTTRVLILSATVADEPEKFAMCGYVLKLYNNPRHARNWIHRLQTEYADKCGHPMAAIHKRIYPECASRMCKSDLPDEFQPNHVAAECYDMDTAKEIQEMYELIAEEEQKLKRKEDLSQCPLARITYARMRIETLKIPTLIRLAKEEIAAGNSIVLFVNFTQTLLTLGDELNTNCFIYGEQSLKERNENIRLFKSDASRIIICNLQSGGLGISLHDEIGQYPRVSIISPSWTAQDIIQALGRIHRNNGKTICRQYIVYCQGTVEGEICANMRSKIRNIGLLNDGGVQNYQIKGLVETDGETGSEPAMTTRQLIQHKLELLVDRKRFLQEEIHRIDEKIDTLTAELWSGNVA